MRSFKEVNFSPSNGSERMSEFRFSGTERFQSRSGEHERQAQTAWHPKNCRQSPDGTHKLKTRVHASNSKFVGETLQVLAKVEWILFNWTLADVTR